MAEAASINIVKAIEGKMELNDKKYPEKESQGSVQKYTAYTKITGITKHNQKTQLTDSSLTTYNNLPQILHGFARNAQEFAKRRDWTKFDNKENFLTGHHCSMETNNKGN